MSRVLSAMSGGLDSSVATALLVKAGHDVIGVSLQLSDESRGGAVSRCCSFCNAAHLRTGDSTLAQQNLSDRTNDDRATEFGVVHGARERRLNAGRKFCRIRQHDS